VIKCDRCPNDAANCRVYVTFFSVDEPATQTSLIMCIKCNREFARWFDKEDKND